MNNPFRWLSAWTLMLMADAIWRLTGRGYYPLYNWLAVTSAKVQGDTDFGPWKTP